MQYCISAKSILLNTLIFNTTALIEIFFLVLEIFYHLIMKVYSK